MIEIYVDASFVEHTTDPTSYAGFIIIDNYCTAYPFVSPKFTAACSCCAEIMSIDYAIQHCIKMFGVPPSVVYSDCQSAVDLLCGKSKAKSPSVKDVLGRIDKGLISNIKFQFPLTYIAAPTEKHPEKKKPIMNEHFWLIYVCDGMAKTGIKKGGKHWKRYAQKATMKSIPFVHPIQQIN